MTTAGRGLAFVLGERGVPEGVGATGPSTGITFQSHCGSLSFGRGASIAIAAAGAVGPERWAGAVGPLVVDNAAGVWAVCLRDAGILDGGFGTGAEVLEDKDDTEDRADDPSEAVVFDFCIGRGFGLLLVGLETWTAPVSDGAFFVVCVAPVGVGPLFFCFPAGFRDLSGASGESSLSESSFADDWWPVGAGTFSTFTCTF